MITEHTTLQNHKLNLEILKQISDDESFYLLALAIGRFLLHLNSSSAALFALGTVALPAAVPATTMLAGRYKVYGSEAASTLILTSFLMIGIVPFFQYLAGFL